MAKIEDLQQIDLKAIENDGLKNAVNDIINAHDIAKDKTAFKKAEKANIDKIFGFVKKLHPETIIEQPKKESKEKSSEKTVEKEKKTPKLCPEEREKILEEIKAYEPQLKECRATIREYNKKKKEAEGEKPKPTQLQKIKEHFVSIANLIPEKLKDNLEAQKETERIILTAQRGIIKAYQMNKLKSAKKVEEEIKEKFDNIEEKIEKKESK